MHAETSGGTEDVWSLDPGLTITLTADRVLLLESGPTIHRIANKVAVDVAETLFATSTSHVSIPAALSPEDREVAHGLLTALAGMGHAVRHPPTSDDGSLDLYFETRRRATRPLTPEQLRERLGHAAVPVVGSGGVTEIVRAELLRVGVEPLDADGASSPADLVVYVADGEAAKGVDAFNRERLDDGARTPWLLVEPFDGARSCVGPLVVPETSACAECYRLRRLSNFPDDAVSQELEGATVLAAGQVGTAASLSHAFVAGMVAQVVVDHLVSGVDGPTSMPGFVRVLTNTATELSLRTHRVLRVPRCPRCSRARGAGSPQIWFPAGVGTESSAHA